MRERRQQVEHPPRRRHIHLRFEGADEAFPFSSPSPPPCPAPSAPRWARGRETKRRTSRRAHPQPSFRTPRGGRRTVPIRVPSWGSRGSPRRTILRVTMCPSRSERVRTLLILPPGWSDVGERIEVEERPAQEGPVNALGPSIASPILWASRKLMSPRHQATRAASGPRTHTGSGKPGF